jgi:riboflavin synthase
MFTGLVETKGLIHELKSRGNYSVMTVTSSIPGDQIRIGESIACNGACLTVVDTGEDHFTVEISQETAERVDMGRFRAGSQLNLERALQLGARLGGHLVSGHVDTVGRVDYLRPVGQSLELAVTFDQRFDPLVIDKGSVALDGVSLTINRCRSGWLSVNLIPHTAKQTTLSQLRPGDAVNLEFDLIGKYVIKSQQLGTSRGITEETLRESGW